MKFKLIVMVFGGDDTLVSRHYSSTGYIKKQFLKNGEHRQKIIRRMNPLMDIHPMEYIDTITYLRGQNEIS